MTKAKPPAAKRKVGRPKGSGSLFTRELADSICERLGEGEPLQQICRDDGMPGVQTVYDWMAAHQAFAVQFAQARARGYDAIAAEALKIADDAKNDWMERNGADSPGWQLNGEHVQRSKLRIETRLKLLAKWDPKRYGDKLAIGGADDLPPLKTSTDEQLEARIAALQAKLEGKAK